MNKKKKFPVMSLIFIVASLVVYLLARGSIGLEYLALGLSFIGMILLYFFTDNLYLEKYGPEDLQELMTVSGFKEIKGAIVNQWNDPVKKKHIFRIVEPLATKVIQFTNLDCHGRRINRRYYLYEYGDLGVVLDIFDWQYLVFRKEAAPAV